MSSKWIYNEQAALNTELPIKIHLSFERMFQYWEDKANSEDQTFAEVARLVLKKIKKAKVLRKPFEDLSILKEYREEIELLLKPLFSDLLTDNEIKSASLPFKPVIFNPTRRFRKILENSGPNHDLVMRNFDHQFLYVAMGTLILKQQYGIEVEFKRPFFFDIPDHKTGANLSYRILFNADFMEFEPGERKLDLSKEDIKELIDNFDDIELWKEKIPPNSFNAYGFGVINLFDVSTDECISRLKLDLLRKDALVSPEIVENIRSNLSSLLSVSDLKLGFALYDEDGDSLRSLGYGFWNSIALAGKNKMSGCEAFCDFSFGQVFKCKEGLSVSEFTEEMAEKSPLAKKIIEQGFQSYVSTPLQYDGKVIGILELGSKTPWALNSVVANKLADVTPLFTIALQRTLDEYETGLESIIQEKCTAIHPSVYWRFYEAAENLYKKQKFFDIDAMEEIVFPNVFPLYGQSDIKSSSTIRNKAIQADMVEQLTLARDVMELAIVEEGLPVYKGLRFRISKWINHIHNELGAGDELSVLDFLKTEVYPVFEHLRSRSTTLDEAIVKYNAELDKDLGVVYKKRKEFEESVALLNDKLSEVIERQEHIAQEMFPHYFEKYKTDGVEYNIYIGQSMLKNRNYDPIYLKNLRLWQLMLTCEAENHVHQLRPALSVPLEICSLILIHDNPLAIKFRQDEKQFDVDGAYNIRYEIVKKRIDKAYIKGTSERLTQPGKLAIVYSQPKEAAEYRHYLEYLQSINYIADNIEMLELEELPGASGLKALRAELVYDEERAEMTSQAEEMLKSSN